MKSNNKTKSFKDSFYDFFDSPSRDKFRDLMLDNTGEHHDLDFKMEVPDSYPIIAKDIIAMANKAGGLLIFGVVEDKTINSFEPVGLVHATEKTEFETKWSEEDKLINNNIKNGKKIVGYDEETFLPIFE